MDKKPKKALVNFLVVVVCIFALAFHCVIESAGSTNIPVSIALNADEEGSPDQLEHSEDDFALTKPSGTYQDIILLFAILAMTVFCILPISQPHLPPPKIQTPA